MSKWLSPSTSRSVYDSQIHSHHVILLARLENMKVISPNQSSKLGLYHVFCELGFPKCHKRCDGNNR